MGLYNSMLGELELNLKKNDSERSSQKLWKYQFKLTDSLNFQSPDKCQVNETLKTKFPITFRLVRPVTHLKSGDIYRPLPIIISCLMMIGRRRPKYLLVAKMTLPRCAREVPHEWTRTEPRPSRTTSPLLTEQWRGQNTSNAKKY